MVTYKNYIAGNWITSFSGTVFSSTNPANPHDNLGYFQASTSKDVTSAVTAAAKSYPFWSAMPVPQRARLLFLAAGLLRKEKQRLAMLVTREMGKVLAEALADVQEAIDVFEYMAGEGRRFFGYTTPSELSDKWCMTFRRPLGVVGLITPWNFPLAIPAWKLAPALLCGNTVVLKPSSETPLCAIELIKILVSAGIPPGVVNLLTGSGDAVGMPLLTHPLVRAISFTGSRETGLEITRHAGIKKIGLELGGKNAIIVMDDANLDLAVDGILWGAFATTGQRCTATSRVIAHEKIISLLTKKLFARMKKLTLGDGSLGSTDIGPLINEVAVKKSLRYCVQGVNEGAKLLYGGRRVSRQGYFFQPTLFTDVTPHMSIAQEEIFGPILCLLPAKNFTHAISISNAVDYGLSSALYTKDITLAFKAMQQLETGITYINASTIGAEVHLPFGGVKATGNGTREAGIEGIHEFSETKTVYVDYSGKLQKAQINTSPHEQVK